MPLQFTRYQKKGSGDDRAQNTQTANIRVATLQLHPSESAADEVCSG
jgi:hypothetical protein